MAGSQSDYEDWAQQATKFFTRGFARYHGVDLPLEIYLENGKGWSGKGDHVRASDKGDRVNVYVGLQTDFDEKEFYKKVAWNLAEEIGESRHYDLTEAEVMSIAGYIHPEMDLRPSLFERAKRSIDIKNVLSPNSTR